MSALPVALTPILLSAAERPHEKVKCALDVWASLLHHQAAGGGGWPLLGECLERVTDPSPLPELRRGLKREGEEEGPCAEALPTVEEACDHRTLLVSTAVHTSLKRCGCPAYLKAYLLLRHPREGRFQPPRSLANLDEQEASLRFVKEWKEGKEVTGTLGICRSSQGAARHVRTQYSRLLRVLERDLKGF